MAGGVTELRAVWDMYLSQTLEHFPVLFCPLSLSRSHLLSKDTNVKKKINPLQKSIRVFSFFLPHLHKLALPEAEEK